MLQVIALTSPYRQREVIAGRQFLGTDRVAAEREARHSTSVLTKARSSVNVASGRQEAHTVLLHNGALHGTRARVKVAPNGCAFILRKLESQSQ